ncbi:hypothetical protein, partial [Stutzerimonas stutzeri]|uniref:hypothetical protein n=1 Tax=Stutzerimonas stutzeri TaxID=316 RepID=UPI001D01A058
PAAMQAEGLPEAPSISRGLPVITLAPYVHKKLHRAALRWCRARRGFSTDCRFSTVSEKS